LSLLHHQLHLDWETADWGGARRSMGIHSAAVPLGLVPRLNLRGLPGKARGFPIFG
jgi:hypothetical protein